LRKARSGLEFSRSGGPPDCNIALQDFRAPNTRVPDWKFHFPGRSIKADVPTAIARLVREKLVRQRE
jgi:hypothetical protein